MSVDHRDGPRAYEIRIAGHLDPRWVAWFDGLDLTRRGDGTTVLAGRLPDQSALHGVLQALRDLGLPLISVTPTGPAAGAPPAPPRPGCR